MTAPRARPDYATRMIALDPSETGSGFDEPKEARARALEHCARMAETFEEYNAPQMRRDWGRDLLDALRPALWPALWLLVAALLALMLVHALPIAAHHYAQPAQIGGAPW